jgi:hypothetical protein
MPRSKSDRQLFLAACTPGAVFTVEWPEPLKIQGNLVTSTLAKPPELRRVHRVVASSNRVYFLKPDGAETVFEFTGDSLVRREDGAFEIYWGPGRKVSHVYHPGDVRDKLMEVQ